MGLLDPPFVPPPGDGPPDEPYTDEFISQRWVEGPIGGTLAQPLWVATAPWPCRFVSMTLLVPDYSVDPVVKADRSDYWDFFPRKHRADFVFPVPAKVNGQPVHGVSPGDILRKSTTVTPISAGFPFMLHEAEMDSENRMFRPGDWLGLAISRLGAPPNLPGFGLQARFERA